MTVEGLIILGGFAAGGVLMPWIITHCQVAMQAGAVHLQCRMQSYRLFLTGATTMADDVLGGVAATAVVGETPACNVVNVVGGGAGIRGGTEMGAMAGGMPAAAS